MRNSAARGIRRVAKALAPVAVVAALAGLSPLLTTAAGAAPVSPDAASRWGASGAVYSGGIVCQLPGGELVPMTRWSVNGVQAFSTTDVVGSNTTYGAAPASTPATTNATQAGFDAHTVAAAAYLISQHGHGSAAEVAQTSADIAFMAGGGTAQSQCLGQQGTSAEQARQLWLAAQRFAGPYTVTIGSRDAAKPSSPVTVTATVRSATGAPTPGIAVTFSAGAAEVSATTGHNGIARAQLITPAAAQTPLHAAESAPIGLTYFGGSPASVALAPATTVTATGTLTAVLHPKPAVSVTTGSPLLLANGRTSISAGVSGTYGYSGTGTATVVGPVTAPGAESCSSLSARDFDAAPTAWSGTFSFAGDGTQSIGKTSALAVGCYAARANVVTGESTPPAHAVSRLWHRDVITVSGVTVTTSTGAGIAPTGPLHADLAADNAAGAKVTSTVTAYGPIVTHDGQCDTSLDWSNAPVAGSSTEVDLTPKPTATTVSTTSGVANEAAPASNGDVALAARVSTPRVDKLGCYAFETQSTITEDGKTLTVGAPAGSKGTTVLVMRPQLALTTSSYGGQQGAAMSGTVSVVGAYQYPGVVHVGLESVPPTATGCRDVSFAAAANAARTTAVHVTGDGDFAFKTPVATRNACYAVTATLSLDANARVRSQSSAPSAASVFLAGVQLHDPTSDPLPHPQADGMIRPVVAMAGTAVLLLVVAFIVIGVGISARTQRR